MSIATDQYDDIEIHDHRQLIDLFGASQGEKVIRCTAGSKLNYLVIVQDANVTITIHQHAGSHTHIQAIVLSSGVASSLTLNTVLSESDSHSQINVVSFCTPHSECQIDAGVTMEHGISGASGHLLEKNILLGGSLKLRTLPLLDIRSNDIVASHGAQVSSLDSGPMFYCMSRGLSKAQSTQLMIDSIVHTHMSHIQSDPIIVPLQNLLSNYILSLMGISGPQIHAPSNRSQRVSHHLHSTQQKP